MTTVQDLKSEGAFWLKRWKNTYPEMEPRPEVCWSGVLLDQIRKEQPSQVVWAFDVMNAAEREHVSTIVHFGMRWASYGCPTFNLSHGLMAKLLQTDCSGLSWRDLKFPFSSFVVTLPGPDPFIVYEGEPGQEVTARYLIFHKYTMAGIGAEQGAAVDIVLEDEAEFVERFGSEPVIFAGVQCPGAPMLHRKTAEPAENDSLESFLTKYTDASTASKLGVGLEYSNLDGDAMRASIRLLANLSLYLQSLRAQGEWNPEPVQPKRKKKAKKLTKHWHLGAGIKLAPEIRAAALQNVSMPKWKLAARYMVRGHWRNQAHGPNHSLRKLKWIEPFWKGPTAAEVMNRPYSVEE